MNFNKTVFLLICTAIFGGCIETGIDDGSSEDFDDSLSISVRCLGPADCSGAFPQTVHSVQSLIFLTNDGCSTWDGSNAAVIATGFEDTFCNANKCEFAISAWEGEEGDGNFITFDNTKIKSISAFIDLNGDEEVTTGEPYFCGDVDIESGNKELSITITTVK